MANLSPKSRCTILNVVDGKPIGLINSKIYDCCDKNSKSHCNLKMVNSIVENIVEFIFQMIFEVLFFYTGEIVLYVISFTKKKPRWDFYAKASATKFVLLTELSVWIGIAFWICIIILAVKLFS
jgi:hypothetical protein